MTSHNSIARKLAAAAVGLIMASNFALATSASAYPAGGGDFSSSVGWASVSASYYHPSLPHSATACAMSSCAKSLKRWGELATVSKFGFWGRQAWWNVYGSEYF